jgi:acetylornithine deacetylase/succinyl-diaminopimelate desuccinylase-like protein
VQQQCNGPVGRPGLSVCEPRGGGHGRQLRLPVVPERAALERRTTEILQRLIRFNTVNPPGNEGAAQEWLKGVLDEAGFDCLLLEDVPGRPNLVARLAGPADGPALCLLGHVDTVPADPDDWQLDPWSGELRDGCVWGRGAKDMKSQVAAELGATLVLLDEGWRPEAGELKLVFTCDEERGARHGAQWLCAEQPEHVRADLVVNEGAGELMRRGDRRVYGVCVGEKGVFRFTLSTSGRAGHASVPRIGDNALVKMAPVLSALAERRPAHVPSPEARALLRALGLDEDDLDGALAELEASDPALAVLVEPMLGVTLTPTMIGASQAINVVPAHARLEVDCRVPPELGEEAVRDAIEQTLGSDGFEIGFAETIVGNRSPIDTPLMDSIRRFVEREDPGATVAPVAMSGFSDSHWWRKAFPDCIAYGFYPQNAMDVTEAFPLMHGKDERMPVADLGLAAAFYADLMVETLR